MRRAIPIAFLFLSAFSLLLPAEPRRIRMTFLGDVMAHKANFQMASYDDIYAAVAPLLRADDLTFANLEFVIDPDRPYATYPRFNVQPGYVEAAIRAGMDVFSLANNHSYDAGRQGALQTLRSMGLLAEEAGRPVRFSGLRPDAGEGFRPQRIEVNGVRLGFLAVTQFTNDHHRHAEVHTVDYNVETDVEPFLAFIREARPGFDLLVLSYHGGAEYRPEPEPARSAFFYRLVEAGVDIVYGHHPHVLQRYELIRWDGGTRLVIHSAGNFISAMTWGLDPSQPHHDLAATGDSMMYVVEAQLGEEGGLRLAVDPQTISTGRNQRGELMVDLLESLIRGEQGPLWAAYYRERGRLLEPLLRPREVLLDP
jgi:poly-gamma-glutamate synthesis protein (capsule biosynthesis protein)